MQEYTNIRWINYQPLLSNLTCAVLHLIYEEIVCKQKAFIKKKKIADNFDSMFLESLIFFIKGVLQDDRKCR